LEQDQSENTDAESLEEAKKSNTKEHKKPEEDMDQQTMNPPSKRLICRSKAEAEPETMKKVPVKPYVPLIHFP